MSAQTQCRRCGGYFPVGQVDFTSFLCRGCKAAPIVSRVKAAMSVVNHLQEQSRFEQTVKLLEGRVRDAEAERDQLKAENEHWRRYCDGLQADKQALTETHVLYTWLRKKADQKGNDVVAVHMKAGQDWVPVYDLDRDLRAMIDREEP